MVNSRQQRVVNLLLENSARDLYDGASASDPKIGCGYFYVTYSADEVYHPLYRGDVDSLLSAGLIRKKYPNYDGCFVLTELALRTQAESKQKPDDQ